VNTFIDQQWSRSQFIARPLSNRWESKLQPILALNTSRLLLAAGNTIYSYEFGTSDRVLDDAPSVFLEGIYCTSDSTHPKSDITSLTCIPECEDDRMVFVGYANGTMEKLVLPPAKVGSQDIIFVPSSSREAFDDHVDSIVESISASSTHFLSVSSSGSASLRALSGEPSENILLDARGWSSLLSTRSSRQYAAFGTSSIHPLAVHDVLPTGISPNPFFLLDVPADYSRPTAVYDITSAPISSPWGASDQIVVSGWFDGFVRVHDLRACTTSSSDNPGSLQPALAFEDPWSFEPVYSVSCGGGASAHIGAGSARHSVVSFWDVRYAGKGWSVHAPGNDSSPVYSVVIDGPRVFGANQSRGFVLDFGPGVQEGTYPAIEINNQTGPRARPRRRVGDENLTKTVVGPGFYVTKYTHAQSRWTGKSL